jgi:hypothetical protein
MADSVQLHQIVINLITNAYHAVDQSEGKNQCPVKGAIRHHERSAGKNSIQMVNM